MLENLKKVVINKTDRLSKEDLMKMEELQEKFNNAKIIYEDLKVLLNKTISLEPLSSFSFECLQDNFRERLSNTVKDFISEIYWFFGQKYKIELKNNLWNEDLFRWKWSNNPNSWEQAEKFSNELNYEKILDDIYTQTGTFNFADKGIEEFIEKFKNDIGYKISQKNTTIILNSLVCQDQWDVNEISYSSSERLVLLFKAINLLENNNCSLSSWADRFCTLCRNNTITDSFITFKVHTNLPFVDIESIKIFKNGRVDLKFYNYETAKKFYDMFYRKGRWGD